MPTIWLLVQLLAALLGGTNPHRTGAGYDAATLEHVYAYEFRTHCETAHNAPACFGYVEIRAHNAPDDHHLTISLDW